MRVFLIGAIVLVAFAIAATASASNTFLNVAWGSWLAASLLSFFVDILFGWEWANGGFTRRQPPSV